MNINPITAWMIVAIFFFIIEILTPSIFLFSCFGVGALAAGASIFFIKLPWVPWVIFVVISIVSIVITRPIAEKFVGKQARLAGVDSLIGQKGKVIETINSHKNTGLVKVAKEDWRAEAEEKIEQGETVEIIKIDGTHLIVKRSP